MSEETPSASTQYLQAIPLLEPKHLHATPGENSHRWLQVDLLATVAAEAMNGIVITDRHECILYVNPAFERISGYKLDELRGKRPAQVIQGPETDSKTRQRVRTAIDSRQPVVVEILNYHKNGTAYWIEMHIAPVLDQAGEVTHFIAIENDITFRKQMEREQERSAERLRISEERYALAVAGSQNGLWDWNILTGETHFSARWEQMIGYAEGELPARIEGWRQHLHPDDQAHVDAALTAYFSHQTDVYSVEFRMRHKNGLYRWILARGAALFDDDGKPYRMAGSHTDITEQKRLTEQLRLANEWQKLAIAQLTAQRAELRAANTRLEALATTDGLTGLKNHRALQERLREEYDRARRYNTPLSLLILDVDRFKQYNDSFGHPAGDAVLRQLAQILRDSARSGDVVARYGGEEFVVILHKAGVEDAKRVAERFRQQVEGAHWPQRTVTVSIGVATLTAATVHPDALLANADTALYRSKSRGRNCVTHSTDIIEMQSLDTEAAQWYDGLLKRLLAAQADATDNGTEQVRDTLLQAYDSTITSWSRILDLKDKETEGHSKRVTTLMERLMRHLKFNEQEIRFARWGALLHDIGKIAVPDRILHKPGPLTDEEWVIMRAHTTVAYDMLSPITFLGAAIDIPYAHHEKWDGTGYPRGLKGDEIPLMARLFAVIDVYDALTSDRPYRAAWSDDTVRAYLQEHSGTHFDPRAVTALLSLLDTPAPLPTLIFTE